MEFSSGEWESDGSHYKAAGSAQNTHNSTPPSRRTGGERPSGTTLHNLRPEAAQQHHISEDTMPRLTIDSFELARKREEIEGEVPLSEMPELASAVMGVEGDALKFYAEGLGAVRDLPAARLVIEGVVTMPCAYCQKAVEVPVHTDVLYRFVESEEQADNLPVDEDEEGEEVVVGSRSFSIADWVQEEVLLSLPATVRHDECDEPVEMPEKDETKVDTVRPFANLADLMKN